MRASPASRRAAFGLLRLADIAAAQPRRCLLAGLLLTLAAALGLTRMEIRTDGKALYPPADPIVRQSKMDREVFANPELAIVLVSETPEGPRLLSHEGLAILRALDQGLRRLEGVRASGVRSLASLRDLRFEGDRMQTDRLLDGVPAEASVFREWLARMRSLPLVEGTLLSTDGRQAAIYLPLSLAGERESFLRALREHLDRTALPFELLPTGPLMAETLLGESLLRDLEKLIPLMVLVISLLLIFFLRSLGGLLIPFVAVMLVLLWTLGVAGWLGMPLTLATALLPILLMAMAITDELHLLERLQAKVAAQKPAPGNIYPAALRPALEELRRPIVITSWTSACGLLAFLASPIEALRHFGLASAGGILLAMVVTFSVVPAVIVLLPVSWFRPQRKTGRPLSPEPASNPALWRLGLGVALVLVAIPGILRLRVEDNWIHNFDPDSEIVAAEERFNQGFWGTHSLDVVLKGPAGFFFQPHGVALAQALEMGLRGLDGVAGQSNYLDLLRFVAQATGEEASLTEERADRLGDWVTLAMMGEDPLGMVSFVTPNGSSARLRLHLKGESYARDRALAGTVQNLLDESLSGVPVRAHISGDIPVGLAMVRSIVESQLRSTGIALLLIAAVLGLAFRHPLHTVLVLLPVAGAALLVLGTMGYLGMPLGVASSMFVGLTLGVGVDFGCHFIAGFEHWRRRTESRKALARTEQSAGKAIRWNALVLALGFLVLALSALAPNRGLGLLLAAALIASFALTRLLLPPLLVRRREPREAQGSLLETAR